MADKPLRLLKLELGPLRVTKALTPMVLKLAELMSSVEAVVAVLEAV